MTPITSASIAERRLELRARLQAQRGQIMRQLDPAPATDSDYPRSKSMRFLIRRPVLAARLLAGIATLLVGARFFRS
jgi:hypothetical protein